VERNDGVIGEAATNSIFSYRHRLAREAGDFRHQTSPISRFTSFDLTAYLAPYSDSQEPK